MSGFLVISSIDISDQLEYINHADLSDKNLFNLNSR